MTGKGLDKLQKEIDALTYNSRSVLNGLIRSVATAGSKDGFSVTRAGVVITLSRVDIYRLYKFYRDWEVNEFSVSDINATVSNKALKGFDTLRVSHDAITVKNDRGVVVDNQGTTSALVKHAKLLYLNSQNISNIDGDDVLWYSLVANAVNPKLVTNSSPIPINLRTPIFDENLATTQYNVHPTYLFPMGYYTLDTLGYQGDGVDHHSGGDSWTIQGTNHVTLESSHVQLGGYSVDSANRTLNNRSSGLYSTTWGWDTRAIGNGSTAGGNYSVAGSVNSVAIGGSAYAAGSHSAAIGGDNATASAYLSAVLGGSFNASHAEGSVVLGGYNNYAGGVPYSFTLGTSTGTEDCYIECVNTCNDTTNRITVSGLPGSELLIINAPISTLSYNVGDQLILYGFSVKTTDRSKVPFTDADGDAFESIYRTISAISTYPQDTSKTQIILNMSVPNSDRIDGGMVTRIRLAGSSQDIAANSLVTGLGNVSVGVAQTVVGRYNKYQNATTSGATDKRNALFIVGSGSYATSRKNSFEVYDDGAVIYGNSSEPRGGSFRGISVNSTGTMIEDTNANIEVTQNRVRSALGYSWSTPPTSGKGVAYLDMYRPDSNNAYTTLRGGRYLRLIGGDVPSSYFSSISNGIDIVSTATRIRSIGDCIITAETSNTLTARYNTSIIAGSNLNLTFSRLNLSGDTFGALPTNSTARSFSYDATNRGGVTNPTQVMFSDVPDTAIDSTVGTNLGNMANGYHLLNIASNNVNGRVRSMQMMWAQCEDLPRKPRYGRIGYRRGNVLDGTTTSSWGEWEYLATKTEVDLLYNQVLASTQLVYNINSVETYPVSSMVFRLYDADVAGQYYDIDMSNNDFHYDLSVSGYTTNFVLEFRLSGTSTTVSTLTGGAFTNAKSLSVFFKDYDNKIILAGYQPRNGFDMTNNIYWVLGNPNAGASSAYRMQAKSRNDKLEMVVEYFGSDYGISVGVGGSTNLPDSSLNQLMKFRGFFINNYTSDSR